MSPSNLQFTNDDGKILKNSIIDLTLTQRRKNSAIFFKNLKPTSAILKYDEDKNTRVLSDSILNHSIAGWSTLSKKAQISVLIIIGSS